MPSPGSSRTSLTVPLPQFSAQSPVPWVIAISTSLKGNTSSTEFSDQFYPSSTTRVVVDHDFYRLSYSEAHEQAEWVAYELREEHVSIGHAVLGVVRTTDEPDGDGVDNASVSRRPRIGV